MLGTTNYPKGRSHYYFNSIKASLVINDYIDVWKLMPLLAPLMGHEFYIKCS